MVGGNGSMHSRGHRDHSGGPWRPPLPPAPPVDGDSHCPVPLWEREFCTQALSITWESFCEKKRGTAIFKNVMDWDDSGAFENLIAAKERFRANYFGKPSEIPLPDPDMYTDKVDPSCKVDPKLAAELDNVWRQSGLDDDSAAATGFGGLANVCLPYGFDVGSAAVTGLGGLANLMPTGFGEPANVKPTGWGEPGNVTPKGQGEMGNPTPEAGGGGQANLPPVRIRGGQASLPPIRIWGAQYSSKLGNSNFCSGGAGAGPSNNRHQQVDPGNWSSGSGMRRNNGGGGGSGEWRNQGEGHHQQRNQVKGQCQQRSGGRQQQGQRGKNMVWRPVQRKEDPGA